ncbi:hypothetical protein [Spirosoma fluviale]|uniref:Lipocalin-like domain-containing protein n=1 Tax=Spirosoma fluviale TaxID=1597977 RepID=A0A286GD13_9BACT|nr:hypothetical protein [Spirosoma fluviale]SOD93402.1 hypothetical protein SAMN06269250_4484 [Spirosoma fluviale]
MKLAGFRVYLPLVLLATLPWSCTDHRPLTNTESLLTGCTAGWKVVNRKFTSSTLNFPNQDCYRLIFQTDHNLVEDQSRCGNGNNKQVLGSWSSTETTLAMPVLQYAPGYAAEYRLDELSATTLVFSWQRGGPDRYIETWTCP